MAVIPYHHMTEVAGHASSVDDSSDHVRLSRIEVDMEAGTPGEAPERSHPSTHRLCGGEQIQHRAETTAGAPVVVKDLLAHRGRLVKHEGRGLVALGSRFWGPPPGFRRRNKARLANYLRPSALDVGGCAPHTRLLPSYESFDWWPQMLSMRQVVGHGTRAL